MKRVLHPSLNPTGISSAIAAIYACAVMIANAVNHHGVISPPVIVAAAAAAAFLFARGKVTPVADPRDGNGQPLTVTTALAPPATWVNSPAILPPISTTTVPLPETPPLPPTP